MQCLQFGQLWLWGSAQLFAAVTLYGFLGHPVKSYMCFLEHVFWPHSLLTEYIPFLFSGSSDSKNPEELSPRKDYITPHHTTCCTESSYWNRTVIIKLLWLGFPCETTKRTTIMLQTINRNPLRFGYFFSQSDWKAYWEMVLYWLRVWPSARGPWAVMDSSTKHASWYFFSQLGKFPDTQCRER